MKDLPGSPFLGLAAAARGVTPNGTNGTPNLDAFPGGLPGALALSHHMSQPGFGLHHFIDPRLPFSAAAGAFRPIFGNTAAAAAAAAIAASASSTSTSATSPQSSDSMASKVTSSVFQPPAGSKGPTSPSAYTTPSSTLFSPGQNLYPRNSAGKMDYPFFLPIELTALFETVTDRARKNISWGKQHTTRFSYS